MPRTIQLTLALSFAAFGMASAIAADINLAQPVPKIEQRVPVRLDTGTSDRVIEFSLWKSDVQVDDVVGELRSGVFCGAPRPVPYSKKFDDYLSAAVARSFRERAVSLGFTSADSAQSLFDGKAGSGADFRLGATLLNLDYRVCGSEDHTGQAYTKVKWEVFSARRQKVVYTVSIDSSFASTTSIASRDFDKAWIRSMIDNLLADQKFVDVIRSGGSVPDDGAKVLATLQLETGAAVAGGVSKAAIDLRAAVVTVESGIGSGTAFYVSQDGYLLSNAHVVADAKFVRVKFADGRSMVGEVLRVDKPRDVALLRTDPVSVGVLAVRRDEARVGEEVYALGSPFGNMLVGTLTRGVLSSRRVLEGVAYLQSDVAINPGNSGGPLVDANGQVLGIAQLRSTEPGLNLFVPIDDALSKLALKLHAKR